jgi:hypothetical protein
MSDQQASTENRVEALTRAIESRIEQGYTVQSKDDTQAVLVMKGRKRFMRASAETRQLITIDEAGAARFSKMDEPQA